jgi:hypothetical protein
VRVAPAHQRLHFSDTAVGESQQRLVVHLEGTLLQAPAQIGFQFHASFGGSCQYPAGAKLTPLTGEEGQTGVDA